MDTVSIDEVRKYWSKRNIPQQWYSTKEPFTAQWFNELAHKRYHVYYEYLKKDAEFDFHKNEKVLEVGCGIGTDLAQFALGGAHVTGIDLGQDQVDLTRLNFQQRGLGCEELKVANAENLPFEDESFDLVFSFGVLHHTPDTQKAIDEVFRVLKHDGQAIIMLYAKGWKHYLKRCFIHGILKGRLIAHKFNWQKVYDEVSEVHGNSPKSGIYNYKEAKAFFGKFNQVFLKKRRLGEFIEYPPYRTFMFPVIFKNFFVFLGAEAFLGENWLIKAYKSPAPPKESVFNVIYKHY